MSSRRFWSWLLLGLTTARRARTRVVPPSHVENPGAGPGELGEQALGQVQLAIAARRALVGNGSLDLFTISGDGD